MSGKHYKRETSIDKPWKQQRGHRASWNILWRDEGEQGNQLGQGNGRDREHTVSLDHEGPKQSLSKFASTRLGASKGRHKHPEVQWKDFRLQPSIHPRRTYVLGESLISHEHALIMHLGVAKHNGKHKKWMVDSKAEFQGQENNQSM